MGRKGAKSEKLDRIMSWFCWAAGVAVALYSLVSLGSPDVRRTMICLATACFLLLAPWLKKRIDKLA